MLRAGVLLSVLLVELHGASGRIIYVNPAEVTSVRPPLEDGKHFAKGIRCLVFGADGKYVAVIETCLEVRERLAK